MKRKVTPDLIQASARQLRLMRVTRSRAQALAPEIERLNNAALEAATHNDFNDEPSSFALTLARLQTPDSRA